MNQGPRRSSNLQKGFIASLAEDVAGALNRRLESDGQASRRDLVRTAFAALEGTAWVFREHISSVATDLDAITFEERLALSEMSYQVTEQGKVVGQPRYLLLPATIRLSARLAMRLSPDLEIRFDDGGWEQFRRAATIRNRVTHPKNEGDLRIDEADVTTVLTAFLWLLDIATRAMEASNVRLAGHVGDLREIFEGLKNGDPDIWAEYEAASRRLAD